jgi:hypothetical protein
VTSILGGNVDMVIRLPSAIMPQVAAGKSWRSPRPGRSGPTSQDMRALAVGIDVIGGRKVRDAGAEARRAVVQKLTAALREASRTSSSS